jgi:flagellar basal-body rod protein FlgC
LKGFAVNLFGVMDVSSSALRAERVRAEVVASNMANAETTRTVDGGPYKRHHVVFSADGSGSASFGTVMGGQMAPMPAMASMGTSGSAFSSNGAAGGHPDAGPDGYVSYPDINPLTEMVDLMGATRAYGMNASAVQAEKGMIASSLDILK